MVVEPSGETVSTAKACMELLSHRGLIAWEIRSEFVHALQLTVVEMLARQVLNEELDSARAEELEITATVMVKTTKEISSGR